MPPKRATWLDQQPTKILIVDDSANDRRLLRRILEPEGFTLVEAENGISAIELFYTENPDVVVLDGLMPGMDGFETCAEIRASQYDLDVPILMLTSLDDEKSVDQAFEVGATDYITKPIPAAVLRRRIGHLARTAQAEKRLAQRNRFLEHLARASQVAASTLELDAILAGVVEVATKALDVTSGYICDFEVEAGTTTVLAEYFSEDATTEEMESDLGETYSLRDTFPTTARWLIQPTAYLMLQKGMPHLEPQEHAQIKYYKLQASLLVPIYTKGDIFGYLEFWETRLPRAFNIEEIELAQAIANQLGVTIGNAQLFSALKASEAEMRQQNLELETRNRELDAYGHSIAHDLKTPLQNVLGFAESIEDIDGPQLSPTSQEDIVRIQRSARDMATMIDQLLILASLRNNATEAQRVSMQRVISTVIEQFEAHLTTKNIALDISQPLPDLFGHQIWLQEIMANLIGNAIKYMGDANDTPTISIYAEPNGTTARYHVQDSGIGIEESDQERLFEMFTRTHSIPAEGFGLGLSIVHRLVTQMNGSVGVDSTPSQGSTFWFTLPMAPQE